MIKFINCVTKKIKKDKWSPDICFGYALETNKFSRSEIVCTKTLYNYIDFGLLEVDNTDLHLNIDKHLLYSSLLIL